MKLWGGRFKKGTDKSVNDFNSSIPFLSIVYSTQLLLITLYIPITIPSYITLYFITKPPFVNFLSIIPMINMSKSRF